MHAQEKHIAIYSRKSKFTGKGESIENQITQCKNYLCRTMDEDVLDSIKIYEDEGFSGGNLNRPQFKQLMLDARAGIISHIVVYRLDRISRNVGDFAQLIEELTRLNISFISVTECFDTTSPLGRAMMNMASVFSQLERETITERVRDNMHELAKTGRWLGGTTPTGFESESISTISIDGKQRKACKLKLIPTEAELIRFIYNKFLETESLTKTETYLLVNDYYTKNGKRFSRFAIKNILLNPVYMIADNDAYQYLIDNEVDLYLPAGLSSPKEAFNGKNGIMAYNRTYQADGKANKLRDKKEWIVSVGKHPGLIPGADWIRVQKLLERNRSKSYYGPKSNVALLSGLLVCGNCGDYMRPKATRGTAKDGNQNYYYLCATKEKSRLQLCNMKNPNGNILDKLVVDEIKKLANAGHDFLKSLEHGKKTISGEAQDYTTQIEQLKKQIADNTQEINALTSTLANVAGSSAEKYIIEKIEILDKANTDLNDKIEELEHLNSKCTVYNLEFDLVKDMIRSIGSSIDNMTLPQKCAALRTIIKKIIWDGQNAHLYLFCVDGDYELPINLSNNQQIQANTPDSNAVEETSCTAPSCEDSE